MDFIGNIFFHTGLSTFKILFHSFLFWLYSRLCWVNGADLSRRLPVTLLLSQPITYISSLIQPPSPLWSSYSSLSRDHHFNSLSYVVFHSPNLFQNRTCCLLVSVQNSLFFLACDGSNLLKNAIHIVTDRQKHPNNCVELFSCECKGTLSY